MSHGTGRRARLMRAVLAVLSAISPASAGAAAPGMGEERAYVGLDHRGAVLPDSARTETGLPTVAIYKDNGVWSTGYEHLKLFFREHGFPYVSVSASAIRGGYLERERPAVLVMPGGSSWKYLDALDATGAAKIRDFVAAGGGYVGICAGAFYAVSRREGGHATGPYGIGLLTGTAYDGTALGTPPFKDGMLDFEMAPPDAPASQRMVLLGGPSFLYSDEEAAAKNIAVVARFQGIAQPAMITFEYGEGRVFLAGPHLEVEENRTGWGAGYHDPESDWPLLLRMVREVERP